jgi:EAL domain-containing protein (putative c-di-GMP-specific phosphodiesterase class I)
MANSCRLLKNWNQQYDPKLHISMNISGAQLQREGLLQQLHQEIVSVGESACNLHIEVTETFLLKNEKQSGETLQRIKAIGPQVWLDDFGTGYSAFSHLKRFNVDGIKIDKSFISGIESNQESRALTRALVAMSKALEIRVIAEGVENAAQWEYLKECGCDYAQGYLLGKPMTAEEFEKILQLKKIRQPINGGKTPAGTSEKLT